MTVYLPPGYGSNPERRYPVLYMQDGQNLFNPAESFAGVVWAADETAQNLIFRGQIEPLIIVGIYNTGEKRIDEYTPVKGTFGRTRAYGGEADAYGRMMIEELKPFIDGQYLTLPQREHTGIGGSSLGGLVSLYLAFKRPDVFSRVAAVSPSVWWASGYLTREISRLPQKLPLRIWLDIGKKEGLRIRQQIRALRELLLAKGWQSNLDLAYLEGSQSQS